MKAFRMSAVSALFFLLFYGKGISQTGSEMAKARADMAVPDAPAFKILEVEPSNIMRPSNLREVGLSLSNFLLGGGVLPKAFAAELSPGLLLGNVTLDRYQKSPFWYRMRISAGTKTSSNGATDLAIGLRFTFQDESDLRSDQIIQGVILNAARAINDIETEDQKQLPADYYFPSDSSNAKSEKSASAFKASRQSQISGYEAAIVRARDKAKKESWNKPIFEAGLAAVGSSKDSLAKNLLASRYGVWLTRGFSLFGQNDQTLLGFKGLLGRNSKGELTQGEGSFAFRSYYGENSEKGFVEADWTFNSEMSPSFSFRIGGEIDIANGFWVDASFGVMKKGIDDSKIVTSLNFRIATPELR